MKYSLKNFLKYAGSIKPSQRQLDWYATEFYAFIHFSPNTYTNLEWGLGNEDPKVFNPVDLDCDSWVEAVKSAGMKGLILTAKHHDGYCLWQTETTLHSMKSSPFKDGKGDIVKEAAEACKRGGIKFGFYLSPWDRNSKYYGTDEYNDYYCAQLTELLTNYGEVFEVWFDGACGEGPNGKKQEYDFDRYIALIRKYQPNAVIFNDHGPDVRWCGNESGSARYAEWAVIPKELGFRCESQTNEYQIKGTALKGNLDGMYNSDPNIGALSNILYSEELVFAGSEIDMSIRPGWFYHPNEEPHSLERLFRTYVDSVGGNCGFNLNIPPMPSGRFDDRDIKRLAELGGALNKAFGTKLAPEITKDVSIVSDTQVAYTVKFAEATQVNYITLCEDISQGQRVETFCFRNKDDMGKWNSFYNGTCIGNKKICRVSHKLKEFQILISAARDTVNLKEISLY